MLDIKPTGIDHPVVLVNKSALEDRSLLLLLFVFPTRFSEIIACFVVQTSNKWAQFAEFMHLERSKEANV